MSALSRRKALLAELAAMRQILEETSPRDRVGRRALESRISEIGVELKEIADMPDVRPAEARLQFGGNPVIAGLGMDSVFASKSLTLFNDLWHAVGAFEQGVPAAPANQLVLSGVQNSGDGFRILEQTKDVVGSGPTPMRRALDRIADIFAGLAVGDDVWDQTVPASQAALDKMAELMTHLRSSYATMIFATDRTQVELKHNAVARGADLPGQTEVADTNERRDGMLALLPLTREFNLLPQRTEEVAISGIVEPSVGNDHVLELFKLYGAPCQASLRHLTVRRNLRYPYDFWHLLDAQPVANHISRP